MKEENLILQKIIATLIIFVMIIAQCAIIGITAITYAVDMLATNVNNVEFKTYFKSEIEETTSIDSSINASDLKLSIDIAVRNEGYFDGQISLENAGFKIKEDTKSGYIKKIENNIIYLNTVDADEIAKIEVGISYLDETQIQTSTLDQPTKVKLTGTYTSSKGKTEINGESEVSVNWHMPENARTELTAKILTNNVYKIGDENKKIVQILVNSSLAENIYPIKNTKIDIDIPEGAELKEVHRRTTKATNGNKEFTQDNYRVENNKLIISVDNPEIEGNINWAKKAIDSYVITYQFPENIDISNTEIKVNGTITTYDKEKDTGNNILVNAEEQIVKLNTVAEGIITVNKTEKETEIYKGKIYTGESREYISHIKTYVDLAEAIDKLDISENESKFIKEEKNEEEDKINDIEKNANIQYKEVKFNKNNIFSILGDIWTITINGKTTLTEQTEGDEQGFITVSVQNEKAKTLNISTTKPVNNGILEVETIKQILKAEYERDEIKELSKIKNTVTVKYDKNDKTENKATNTSIIKLKETETRANFSISNTKWSTPNTNENIELVATLNTDGEDKNLYKNPMIEIAFPKEVKSVKVKNAEALYKNGLTKDVNKLYKKEDGRYALYVDFKGEQTAYDTNKGLELHLYVDIDVDKSAANKNLQVEMNYTNEYDGTNKIIKKDVSIYEIKNQTNTNVGTPKISAKSSSTESQNIEIITGLTANITTTLGNKEIANGDDVYEGSTIKYAITLTNNSNKDYTNINVNAIQTNGKVWKIVEEDTYNPHYNSRQKEHYYEITDSNEIDLGKIESLKNGKSVVLEYEAMVDLIEDSDNKETFGTINIKSEDEEINKTITTIKNNIKNGELKLKLEEADSRELEWGPNGTIKSVLNITNLTGNALNDVQVNILMSEQLTCKEDYEKYIEIAEYSDRISIANAEKNSNGETEVTLRIGSIAAEEEIEINVLPYVSEFTEKSKNVGVIARATTSGNNQYYSNLLFREAIQSTRDIQVKQKAYLNGKEINANTEVKNEEEVEFIAIIKNNDSTRTTITIENGLEFGLELDEVKLIQNNKEIDKTKEIEGDTVYISTEIAANETITLKVKAKVNTLSLSNKKFKNSVVVTDTETFKNYKSEVEIDTEKGKTVTNDADNPDANAPNDGNPNGDEPNNDNPTNNDPNNNDPTNNNPQDNNTKNNYTVTGTAWIDSNNNGKRESSEKKVSDIEIRAIEATSGKLMEVTTKTDENGTYSLNLPEGKYTIAFLYDTNTYSLSVYQAKGVENSINSDAVSKEITINDKKVIVGATDELKIQSDTSNIDIGLVKKEKFDLKLEKYVSKVVVTNKEGTKTKTFENDTSIPKIEIRGKYLSGSVVLIEYTFKITNVGEVTGYAENIMDKMPSSLNFQSNINQNWYMNDNKLYNSSLANEPIKPGESKEVKVILTKTMTASNTGLIKNTANILESENDNGIRDINETNDESSADLIITISTGKAISFVAITLAISALISSGAYIIVKKHIEE